MRAVEVSSNKRFNIVLVQNLDGDGKFITATAVEGEPA
jgi:hypothetical protein